MEKLSYRDAGVDIDVADEFVSDVKKAVVSTFTKDVIAGVGGFSALYKVPEGYVDPVIVSSTDGVGTKLKIAFMSGIHNTVGIDLVAMCVNDVITSGARPLFFLDYFATGKLDKNVAVRVIEGIINGCKQAGCPLVGGETAELPGFYREGEYDLAGFCVGIVERSKIISGNTISPGDIVVGIMSSGLHSNGYSLVRKLFFDVLKFKVDSYIEALGGTVADVLLKPTKIYVNAVLRLLGTVNVKGMAHITGGGVVGNLSRILPASVDAVIEKGTWSLPEIFSYIRSAGRIGEEEMFRTFNMGVGMCVVVPESDVDTCVDVLNRSGERTFVIGKIVSGSGRVVIK